MREHQVTHTRGETRRAEAQSQRLRRGGTGADRARPLGRCCDPSETGEHCPGAHPLASASEAAHLDQAGYCSVVAAVPSVVGWGGHCVRVAWECAHGLCFLLVSHYLQPTA